MASIVREAYEAVNFNRIPERIQLYEQLIDLAKDHFEIEGKRLEEVVRDHSKNLMTYDSILQECKTIENVIRSKMEEIESDLYKKLNENSQRVLGQKDIQQYIKGEPKYVAALEILLEVQHTRQRLEAVVEAFKAMGWDLTNITKLRVGQLEHVTL